MIDNKVCNCGGTYILKKGKWVCDSCGRPMPQILDSRENQLLAVAEGKFAQEKFIEAEELYADIIKSFPNCYPAYWGLTLAKHGIKYVDDLRTGKKVATCWAPEISSIQDDKNFKKVLEIAPNEEKEYYQKQGQVIENIRKEWQEKAKKIKPYDVFICFKDTDDETRGRTEDSIELSDLYNNLTRDKYNVFFSRYSLEGITAENYEPYIFQALSTAKVMIVYGSKEEYFESTWMKNEWTRFMHKIADGQKQKNALLPVVKGCSPGALPPRLRALQVLDAGKNTFYSDLTRYIDKVLASSEDVVELQRSKIKFDKRQSVSRSQARKIQSRALQVDDVEIISAQGEQLMKVINSFVKQKQYERAEKFCDAWIKSNPTNYRDLEELVNTILKSEQINLSRKYVAYLVDNAPDRKKPKLWSMMLADGYTDVNEWAEYVSQKHVSYEYMQMLLPLVSKNEICLVSAFYDGIAEIDTFSEEVKSMILYVLEFETEKSKKNEFINELIEKAISDTTNNFAYFEFVITLLDNNKYKSALKSFVDTYVDAGNLMELQKVLPDAASYFLQALQKVLPLVEGDLYFRAQCAMIRILFELGYYADGVNETQKMLGYAENDGMYSKVLSDVLEYALKNITPQNVEFADEEVFRMLGFLKDGDDEEYYFGELAQICLDMRYKKGAERYAKLLIGGDRVSKYDGYYYLMLLALDCYNDDEVARLTVDIADTEGYNNWLANCDEEQISLATDYLNTIDNLKVEQQKAREKQIADQKVEKAEKAADKRKKLFAGLLILIALVSSAISILMVLAYNNSPIQDFSIVMMIGFFVTTPTIFGVVVAIFAMVYEIKHNTSYVKKTSTTLKGKETKLSLVKICYLLIIPFFIVNTLTFALDAGRYKYVDDMFYVKQELDGTQTLHAINLDKRKDSGMVIIPDSVDKIDESIFASVYPSELYIPKSVKKIDALSFYGCKKMSIYCEVEEKPEGWENKWNCYYESSGGTYASRSFCPTYWGSKPTILTEDNYKYQIIDDNNVAFAKNSDVEISGDFVIPKQITYRGKTYNVTGIADNAFSEFKELTSITIHEAVTSIGKNAFYNCSGLTRIDIPANVTSIGESAFYGCNFSEGVHIKDIEKWAGIEFGNSDANPLANGSNLYLNGALVTDLVLPSTLNKVGSYAFAGYKSLSSATISAGTTSIGSGAFANCSNLIKVEIPAGVTSIGDSAFANCSNLLRIEIPASVTNMGELVFENCNSSTIYCEVGYQQDEWPSNWNGSANIVWDYKNNDVASDGYIYWFADNGLRYALKDGKALLIRQSIAISGSITIPSEVEYKGTTYSVTSIDSYAFSNCKNLTDVYITNGLENIGGWAFDKCTSLKSFYIPSSVTSVGYNLFLECDLGSDFVINCEANSRPRGWDSRWNYYSYPVNWGYVEDNN